MSRPRNQLEELQFGRDDAESDAADGGLLRAGFIRTRAYDAALAGQKRLIIGRKGSGKSAICVTLAQEVNGGARNRITPSVVTPDDMAVRELHGFELDGMDSTMSKELAWRYILGVQVARSVVGHARQMHQRTIPGTVQALRQFLVHNGEIEEPALQKRFTSVMDRLNGSLSLEAFGMVKIQAGFQGLDQGPKISRQLDLMERGISSAMQDIGCWNTDSEFSIKRRRSILRRRADAEHRCDDILLLVDQLETAWSNSLDSCAIIVGLLRAAKHISRRLPGVRWIIFVRTDIYDQLQYSELDKFRSDEIRLDWTANSLSELVRARASAALGRKVTREELWGTIFPSRINSIDAAHYLVQYTLRRPRDLIQLANVCRDVAFQQGHSTIHPEDIDEALERYSEWKLRDLSGEYLAVYPFLERVLSLFRNTNCRIRRDTLDERLGGDSGRQLLDLYPESRQQLTPAGLIELLFAVGFLGVQRNQRVSFVYDDPRRIELYETEFFIHPCFRRALGVSLGQDDVEPISKDLDTRRSVQPARSPAGLGRTATFCPLCAGWYSADEVNAVDVLGESRPWSEILLTVSKPGLPWLRRGAGPVLYQRDRADIVFRDYRVFCPAGHRLPNTLEKTSVIAVIGNVNSSKSTYLAALSYEMIQEQLLRPLGMDVSHLAGEAALDIRVARVFGERQVLPASERGVIDGPYSFRVTARRRLSGYRQHVLTFFDVAGEDCTDLRTSADLVRYLFDALGVILLIDPEGLPKPGDPLSPRGQARLSSRALVDTLADTMEMVTGIPARELPQTIVVTLAKADLLDLPKETWPSHHLSSDSIDADSSFYVGRLLQHSTECRRALIAEGAQGVVDAAESRFDRRKVFYSAVSATGERAQDGMWSAPRPIGCTVPLALILASADL